MKNPILSAACVATVLLTTAAAAQSPVPNVQDSRALTKWMSDNKVTQDAVGEAWLRVAASQEGIYLRRVRLDNPLKAPNNKTKTVIMRLELFKPMTDAAGTVNSIAFDYDLDCLNQTFRDVVINAYPQHNLTGKPRTEMFKDERWGPVAQDPMMAAVSKDVCPAIIGNKGGMLGGTFGGDGRMDGNSPGAPRER